MTSVAASGHLSAFCPVFASKFPIYYGDYCLSTTLPTFVDSPTPRL